MILLWGTDSARPRLTVSNSITGEANNFLAIFLYV